MTEQEPTWKSLSYCQQFWLCRKCWDIHIQCLQWPTSRGETPERGEEGQPGCTHPWA